MPIQRLRPLLSVVVAMAFAAISLLHVPMMLTAAHAAPPPCHEAADAAAGDAKRHDTQHERSLPDRMTASCPLATLPPPPSAAEPADPRRPDSLGYALAISPRAPSAHIEQPDPPPRAAG